MRRVPSRSDDLNGSTPSPTTHIAGRVTSSIAKELVWAKGEISSSERGQAALVVLPVTFPT
jgi:hypothetical protein